MIRTIFALLIIQSTFFLPMNAVFAQEHAPESTSQQADMSDMTSGKPLNPLVSISTNTHDDPRPLTQVAPPAPVAPPADDRRAFDKHMGDITARKAAEQYEHQREKPRPAPHVRNAPAATPAMPEFRPVAAQAPSAPIVKDNFYSDLAVSKDKFYSDEKNLSASSLRRIPEENFDFVTVLPEVAQTVELSNVDNNRFVCNGPIQDVVYSAEKGLIVKYSGQNAFIKFKILQKSSGELLYAKNPAEFFVVCNGDTYNIIALPKKIQSQTIRLSTGKGQVIKKNQSLMAGLPMERKVLMLINFVHKDEVPESFEIRPIQKRISLFKELEIIHARTIIIEGEGLQLKELKIKNTGDGGLAVLDEGLFLKPEITHNTLAIAIGDGKMQLEQGESTRLYVVELANGGTDGDQ